MLSRIKYMVVSASACLTILLVAGSLPGRGADQTDTLKHIGVFSDVVAHIKSEYVEEPDMKSVTLGALNGLLEAVDPFASYLNADQYQDYLKNKDLKRADVGLVLSKKPGWMGVVGVLPGSPAANAGLSTHDMIESIKGIATRDMPLAYASLLLQGTAGSTVELSVVRARHPEPQTITITRVNLIYPAVETKMLAGSVGYLGIGALTPEEVPQSADAIRRLQKDGAQKLVLDLRNCAVGEPEDGIALANLFLASGRIAYLKGQKVPERDFDADPAKAVTSLPLAVLVNHGTAGGAEVAAAALGGNKRAQLVGEPTYGDAALRRALTMDDGSAIILSVAKYYSPDGKAIQDTRVMPGTLVAGAEPQIEYDENDEPIVEPEAKQPQPKKLEDDPVIKKAVELLGAVAKA
ncbi:MAG: S41 family peptidase [Bryobacteraceae bacterium]